MSRYSDTNVEEVRKQFQKDLFQDCIQLDSPLLLRNVDEDAINKCRLSLYGQLDERSEYQDSDHLLLLSETVQDYSAALDLSFHSLGALPSALSDRLTYDAAADTYQVMCGNDSLTRFQIQATWQTADGLVLTGVLEDLAQQADLARFEAVLQPRDNMFGYAITGLTLV